LPVAVAVAVEELPETDAARAPAETDAVVVAETEVVDYACLW